MPKCQRMTALRGTNEYHVIECEGEATHRITVLAPNEPDVTEVVCDRHSSPETAPGEGETWTVEPLPLAWRNGYERAFAAASHIEPTPTALLRLNVFGIGEVLHHWPAPDSPLSGEWAGESMPELGVHSEEEADQYEAGFFTGWCDGVLEFAARAGQ